VKFILGDETRIGVVLDSNFKILFVSKKTGGILLRRLSDNIAEDSEDNETSPSIYWPYSSIGFRDKRDGSIGFGYGIEGGENENTVLVKEVGPELIDVYRESVYTVPN
jgi:hypothetical protein